MYYVYVLKDQGIPFYVGKGTGKRAYIHERIVREQLDRSTYEFGISHDYNPHKTRKIQKILREGRSIEYEFPFYSENEEDVYSEEKRLIALYGRSNDGGLLVNIHPGGTGGDIWSGLSEEQKDELRRSRRLRVVSDETKEKIRIASTGRKHTDEAKEKIRASKLGKKMGPSKKKGIPATGGNAKGVRQAWNVNLDPGDPRRETHRAGIRKWLDENPHAIRERAGVPYKLIDPDGNLVEGVGIVTLVENYDVSTRIRYLIRGDIDSYKGWTRAEDTDAN